MSDRGKIGYPENDFEHFLREGGRVDGPLIAESVGFFGAAPGTKPVLDGTVIVDADDAADRIEAIEAGLVSLGLFTAAA